MVAAQRLKRCEHTMLVWVRIPNPAQVETSRSYRVAPQSEKERGKEIFGLLRTSDGWAERVHRPDSVR